MATGLNFPWVLKIKTLLENLGKVNLFMHSRRFGETLNTSNNEKYKYYCPFENILL